MFKFAVVALTAAIASEEAQARYSGMQSMHRPTHMSHSRQPQRGQSMHMPPSMMQNRGYGGYNSGYGFGGGHGL